MERGRCPRSPKRSCSSSASSRSADGAPAPAVMPSVGDAAVGVRGGRGTCRCFSSRPWCVPIFTGRRRGRCGRPISSRWPSPWTAGHLFVTTRLFGRDSQAGVVGGVATAFSNLVLLGIPFMLGVFGRQGSRDPVADRLGAPAEHDGGLDQFCSNSSAEERGGQAASARPMLRTFARRLAGNPLIVGILAGLAWRMLPALPMPALAGRFVGALADIAGPLALFAMGLGLPQVRHLRAARPPAIVLSALKLMLMPAVALAMGLAGRPAAAAGQGRSGRRRAALGRQLLSDRHPARHRPGAGLQPDVDCHGLRRW